MTTATTEKQAPVLVAEFPGELELWTAVRALEERRIGRDFIGVFVGENGHQGDGPTEMFLLSVLAPSRLHDQISDAFVHSGATATGTVTEMARRHGLVPHPGAIEDRELKLPMGSEYPDVKNGQRKAG